MAFESGRNWIAAWNRSGVFASTGTQHRTRDLETPLRNADRKLVVPRGSGVATNRRVEAGRAARSEHLSVTPPRAQVTTTIPINAPTAYVEMDARPACRASLRKCNTAIRKPMWGDSEAIWRLSGGGFRLWSLGEGRHLPRVEVQRSMPSLVANATRCGGCHEPPR